MDANKYDLHHRSKESYKVIESTPSRPIKHNLIKEYANLRGTHQDERLIGCCDIIEYFTMDAYQLPMFIGQSNELALLSLRIDIELTVDPNHWLGALYHWNMIFECYSEDMLKVFHAKFNESVALRRHRKPRAFAKYEAKRLMSKWGKSIDLIPVAEYYMELLRDIHSNRQAL